jgi:hypothetical protein
MLSGRSAQSGGIILLALPVRNSVSSVAEVVRPRRNQVPPSLFHPPYCPAGGSQIGGWPHNACIQHLILRQARAPRTSIYNLLPCTNESRSLIVHGQTTNGHNHPPTHPLRYVSAVHAAFLHRMALLAKKVFPRTCQMEKFLWGEGGH